MYLWLITHIVTGFLALISGIGIILLAKGTPLHRYIGRLFAVSLLLSAAAAFVLAFGKRNWFLFAVGLFATYLTLTGWLYLWKFRKRNIPGIKLLFYVLVGLMGAGALYFLFIAVLVLNKGNAAGIVFLFFAGLSTLFVFTDFKVWKKAEHPTEKYLSLHLQRMTGAFISALTAFIVVNNTYLPDFVPAWIWWILPTVLLVPWIRKHAAQVENIEKV